MTDIDATKQQLLTRFGVHQMTNNPAGVGNECTHWIYAALFEARALDHDRALHIGQGGVPYTWGREVAAPAVERGDVAQFHSFRNEFFIYAPDGSGGSYINTATKVRGPNHTGMVFTKPAGGAYYQLESHIHAPGVSLMSIRGATIYFESFAVAVPASAISRVVGSQNWPSSVRPADAEDLMERVGWTSLRAEFGVSAAAASAAIGQIRHGRTPTVDGRDVAALFRVSATGRHRFYRPQASAARLSMSPDQLAAEKQAVIRAMIAGGRAGHSATEDEFGGDNKRARIRDGRFDWSFPQQP
ncbi:hypothetical protein [Methylocella sp.]|uniref:hypothetical protein n=1 Tax=Methylocella sp. TaxID=1978226 RepID=UPI0037841B18